MKKIYWSLFVSMLVCLVLDAIFARLEMGVYALATSIVLFLIIMAMMIIYFRFVKFKCSKCGTVFKGNKVEIFFAAHTPTKRKMRCPVCNEKLWCEDCFEKDEKKDVK